MFRYSSLQEFFFTSTASAGIFFGVKSPAQMFFFFLWERGGRGFSTVAILIFTSPQSECLEQASNKYLLRYTLSLCFTVKIIPKYQWFIIYQDVSKIF